MLWVVPPFLALALSLVLRLSARVKSTAAAQQAPGLVTLPLIMIAYSQSTGALFGGAAVRLSLAMGSWPGPSASACWSAACARSPGPASSASPTKPDPTVSPTSRRTSRSLPNCRNLPHLRTGSHIRPLSTGSGTARA